MADELRTNPLWLLLVAFTGMLYLGESRVGGTALPSASSKVAVGQEWTGLDLEGEPELVQVTHEVNELLAGERRKLRFLIALVPDPQPGATEAGWLFDAYADAIQRAAQAADFLLLRRALPSSWLSGQDPKGAGAKDRQAAVDPDGAERRIEVPGVLVFRHKEDTEVLVLFLVGESPTRGVAHEEFRSVFDLLAEMRGGPWQPTPDAPLRILGPAFSGSAWSLGRALDELSQLAPMAPHTVRIISGTATDSSVRDTLTAHGRREFLTFEATVIPDEVVVGAIYRHLEEQRVSLRKVAVLVESTTGYGDILFASAFGGNAAGPTVTPLIPPPAREVAGPRMAFQFPLHIAQARAAYERGKTARERPAVGSFESRVSQLELSLEDGENAAAGDVLPPLHPRITSFNVDLVLANILGTMAREDVQYVAIFATDPRDKLFLARKIREYLPDVRILTTESNLLYTHPDYRSYFDGAIVGSTYPLFAKNQLWVLPEAVRAHLGELGRSGGTYTRTTRVTQFSDSGAEGVYNATLALLDKKALMKDYGAPCFEVSCSADETERPPIWISAVGHGTLWPLETNSGYDDQGIVLRGSSDSPDPRGHDIVGGLAHTRSFATMLFLISLFATANGGFVWRAWNPRVESVHVPPGLLEPFLPLPGRPTRQRAWLILLLLVLLAGQLMLASLVAIYFRGNWIGSSLAAGAWWRALAAGIATVLAWLVVVAAVLRLCGRSWRIPVLLGLVGAGGVCLALAWRGFPDNAFFYLRAVNVASGLSPVMPILFIGAVLYLCCYHHLRRLYLLARLCLANPLADDAVPGSTWIAPLETTVRRIEEIGLLSVPWRLSTAVGAVGGLAWLSLWRSMLPGFDSESCDAILFTGLTLAYVGLLAATVRFAWLWASVRALLRSLDHHPLTDAFSRLPERMRETLRRRYYAYLPGPTDRLHTARIWLSIGGRFALPRIDEGEDDPFGVRDNRRLAREARDSAGFFAVEGHEEQKVGRPRSGAQSAVQLCLSEHATSLARIVLPSDASFEGKRERVQGPPKAILARAEEFVAIQVVTSLGPKFLQLGNLITFMVLGVLLLNFAFASYPFQPQRLIMVFILTLAIVVTLVLLVALVQADRDPLLSRMAGVKPGRITLDRGLIGQVVTYVVIPLVTIVATQFPQSGHVFDSVFRLLK